MAVRAPQLRRASIPQGPYVPKQKYFSLWDDFMLVLEKLGQHSQKSIGQSSVVLSVGTNKMHIWRSRSCNYNYPYLQNLKSKSKAPTGKSITKVRMTFLRIVSEAIWQILKECSKNKRLSKIKIYMRECHIIHIKGRGFLWNNSRDDLNNGIDELGINKLNRRSC